MDQIDHKKFNRLMASIANATSFSKMTDAKIDLYWERLKVIPEKRLTWTLHKAIDTFDKSGQFPTVGQLKALSKDYRAEQKKRDRVGKKYYTLREALADADHRFFMDGKWYTIGEEREKLPPEIQTMFERM